MACLYCVWQIHVGYLSSFFLLCSALNLRATRALNGALVHILLLHSHSWNRLNKWWVHAVLLPGGDLVAWMKLVHSTKLWASSETTGGPGLTEPFKKSAVKVLSASLKHVGALSRFKCILSTMIDSSHCQVSVTKWKHRDEWDIPLATIGLGPKLNLFQATPGAVFAPQPRFGAVPALGNEAARQGWLQQDTSKGFVSISTIPGDSIYTDMARPYIYAMQSTFEIPFSIQRESPRDGFFDLFRMAATVCVPWLWRDRKIFWHLFATIFWPCKMIFTFFNHHQDILQPQSQQIVCSLFSLTEIGKWNLPLKDKPAADLRQLTFQMSWCCRNKYVTGYSHKTAWAHQILGSWNISCLRCCAALAAPYLQNCVSVCVVVFFGPPNQGMEHVLSNDISLLFTC